MTKQGRQCSRQVNEGESYCWQHKLDELATQPEINEQIALDEDVVKIISGEKDDYIGRALALLYTSNLRRITTDELQRLVADWRSSHPVPDEIASRDEVFKQWGPELEWLDLSGTDLSHMDLRLIQMTHCNLRGAKLNSAQLDGAFLFGCDLSHVDSWVGTFRAASLLQCYITNSRFMYGRFEGASFAHSNLENTKLIDSYHNRDTWYFKARLYCTDFSQARLEGVNLAEASTLFGVRLHLARLAGAEIDFDLLGGKIGEELAGEYEKAAQAYLAIKANLEARGYYADASRAYIKERQMERVASAPWNARRCYGATQLGDKYEYVREQGEMVRTELGASRKDPQLWWFYFRHTIRWLTDWVVELSCAYGESVPRVLASLAVVYLLFTLIYGLTWSIVRVNHTPTTTILKPTRNLIDLGLYSLGAMTTMDTAGLEPRTSWVQVLAGLEALLGITLTGLLGFVLGNRIRRS